MRDPLGASVSSSARQPGLQGKTDGARINRGADPRLNSILKKLNSPLQQGFIQQFDEDSSGKPPYACRFMFNPGEIDVGYSIADGIISPDNQTPDMMKFAGIYPGTTTISFSLLFDRTYECGYFGAGQKARDIGVYEDIGALEAVVGARQNEDLTITDKSGKVTTKSVQGNMTYQPVYVVFGGGGSGQLGLNGTSTAGAGLAFAGYITSLTVNYALFTSRMVPTRAGVQISMQQIVGQNANDYRLRGGSVIERAAYAAANRPSTKSRHRLTL